MNAGALGRRSVDLLEWSLQKILFNHLDEQFFKLAHTKSRYSHRGRIEHDIELILSAMAYAGHRETTRFLRTQNWLNRSVQGGPERPIILRRKLLLMGLW